LVLATDGLWDMLSNSEVAKICTSVISEPQGTRKEKIDRLAKDLTKKAYELGSIDNITTLVVDLATFTK